MGKLCGAPWRSMLETTVEGGAVSRRTWMDSALETATPKAMSASVGFCDRCRKIKTAVLLLPTPTAPLRLATPRCEGHHPIHNHQADELRTQRLQGVARQQESHRGVELQVICRMDEQLQQSIAEN